MAEVLTGKLYHVLLRIISPNGERLDYFLESEEVFLTYEEAKKAKFRWPVEFIYSKNIEIWIEK